LPVFEIRNFFTKGFDSLWVREFRVLVLRRISGISEKEVKIVNKSVISEILNELKPMFDSGEENLDLYLLKISQKFIQSPFMEKRLKGLAELREIVTDKDSSRRRMRNFNSEGLARWIVDNQILESIMQNPHEEMLKRASTIFSFVTFHKMLNEDHINLLWNYSTDRHDSIQSAVHLVILELNKYLSEKLQKLFFQKFISINPDDFDEKIFETFTEFIKRSESLCELSLEPMFSRIMNNSETYEKTVPLFTTLLQGCKSLKVLETFLEKAASNLKIHLFTCQSFSLVIQILKIQMPATRKFELYNRFKSVSGDLVELLINSFQSFQNEKKSELIIKNIKIRLKFWKFLMKDSGFDPQADGIISVKNAFCALVFAEASEKFWQALLKLINQKFHIELCSSILEKMFLTRDPAEVINEFSFEVFFSLFLKVNYMSRNIEIKHEKFHSRLNENLVGYPFLIECVFRGLPETIEVKAMKIITMLKLKLSKNLSVKSEGIWEFYLKSLQKFLNKDPGHVEKSLKLVLLFLDGFKTEEFSQVNCTVLFKSTGETEYNRFLADSNANISTIRKKISDTYKKSSIGMVLINQQGERIDSLYNDFQLNTWNPPYFYTVEFNQVKDLSSTVQFFSKCQDFQVNLLEILPTLSKSNAELAWTILSRVPLINKYVSQFSSVESLTDEVFSTISLYQLVYDLKIIESLTKNSTWLSEFKSSPGISKLNSVFLSHSLQSEESLILEYTTLIISILSAVTSHLDINEEFTKKVLESLIQAANLCNESEQSSQIAKNAKDILTSIRIKNQEVFLTVIRTFSIQELLRATIITCACSYFSSVMCSFFLEQSQAIPELTIYFLENLLSLLDDALNYHTSDSYWSLLCFYINDCALTVELHEKLNGFTKYLERHPCETSSKEPDIVLSGLLKVQKTIFHKLDFQITESFVETLLHSCLFEIPTKSNPSAPKCKHPGTRRDAFELLAELCKTDEKAMAFVLEYLKVQYEDPSWRTCKNADWNYHPRAHEKSETGFVGMKNLGCICYMISTLQQFYHVNLFRETLLRMSKTDAPLDENLLYQLQSLFSGLKNSDKHHVNPRAVCRAFKDWEGRPVNVNEQMDADEFINTFMDRIEHQTKGLPGEDVVKSLFGGELVTELIGQGTCSHRSERAEAFITLPVQVKGLKDLVESLKVFKAGEVLQGSNAYQCDHCESKVTAVRRVCVKYLPNILMITLRRFEFNYDSMKRLKVNDYCEFPMELDMENFTQEGIERLEALKTQEVTGDIQELPKKYPDEYYKFFLRGIIIHLGTAENGHYYSFIKQENSWFEFNDTIVRKIDPSDIPSEAFGGEEKFSYSSNMPSGSKKIRNAYILLYERKIFYSFNKEDESLQPLNLSLKNQEIEFSEVKEENEKYWRCQSSFSPEYFDFVIGLSSEKTCRFTIKFFLTIIIRSKDYPRIVQTLKLIKEQLASSPYLCEWLLELASVKKVLKELLFDCPVTEKRRLIVSLFSSAASGVDAKVQEKFLTRLLMIIEDARAPESLNFCNYFELIYRLSRLNVWMAGNLGLARRLMKYLKKIPQDTLEVEDLKNKDIFLGYDKVVIEEKQELSVGQNGSSLVFLFKILNNHVKDLKNDDLEFFFTSNSLDMFLLESNSKYGGKVVGVFLSKLCKDNKSYSVIYGDYLIGGIDKLNSDKHKPFMRQLFHLLSLQDSFTAERTDLLMVKYMKQLQNNKKYPVATESSIDFLLKCAVKIQPVTQWMQKKKSDIRFLESILSEPVSRNPGKSKEPFTVKNPQHRLESLRKILKGNFSNVELDESEGECLEGELPKGAYLEYFEVSLQKWIPCSIMTNTLEIVHIKNDVEMVSRWLDGLSDYLRVVYKK
jgi:ubiquitin C-terminal hydrolase